MEPTPSPHVTRHMGVSSGKGERTYRQKDRITGEGPLRTGDGAPVSVYLGYDDRFHPPFPTDLGDGVREIERDVEILKALDDIPLEAGGVGHGLNAAQNFGPLQGEPPGHDEADVAAAQNDHAAAGEVALDVDPASSTR